ncbi:hypothetical protein [Paenibacillus dakarensis]|uniref:hypothetical protein n=1 Tax=Paenibacillus dakarensis TaxID=1527293 RepID=UPI0006D5A046|nr:hypothetical protein [Paenibacillus dakarensis]
MNSRLMNDTFRLLQEEWSRDAGIVPDVPCRDMNRMADVLGPHQLEPERQTVLLALYALLYMAQERHRDCSYSDPDLTKRILDGDYLYSFFLQLAVKYRETDLASYLSPILKRQQIALAEGRRIDKELTTYFEMFLCDEFKHKQAGKAM